MSMMTIEKIFSAFVLAACGTDECFPSGRWFDSIRGQVGIGSHFKAAAGRDFRYQLAVERGFHLKRFPTI
jgi:hypothetical protein